MTNQLARRYPWIIPHDKDTIHAGKWYAEMPDFHMATLLHHQNLESTWPAASSFPGPDDALSGEMCNFRMSMGSCYNPCWWIVGPIMLNSTTCLLTLHLTKSLTSFIIPMFSAGRNLSSNNCDRVKLFCLDLNWMGIHGSQRLLLESEGTS